jgi:hypothetical protein
MGKNNVSKIKNQGIFRTFIFVLIALLMTNCVSRRIDLVRTGTVLIEYVPSPKIYVSEAYVYQDGNRLVVSGKVKRRHASAISSSGHVDITILSPEGLIIKKASTLFLPRIIPRKGAQESLFTARFSVIPPQGSKIRVAFHNPSGLPEGE